MRDRKWFLRVNPETWEKAYTGTHGELLQRENATLDEVLLWREIQRLRIKLEEDPDERIERK